MTTLCSGLPDGTPRPAAGNRPLRLDPARVWIVRQGRIDVFGTRLDGAGEPTGTRRHLFRLEAGDPVFGLGEDPASGRALLAVGAPGTMLAEYGVAEFEALARDEGTRAEFDALVQHWAERVWDGLVGRATVRRATGGALGEEVWLPAGFNLRPDQAMVWIDAVEGELCLLGRRTAPLGPGEMMPLTRRAWAEAVGAARVRLLDTAAVLAAEGVEGVWRALARLHHVAMELAAERARAESQAYADRLQAREKARAAGMAGGLSRLASTLETTQQRMGMRLRPPEGADEDTLFAAFRLVAQAQGLRVEPPASRAQVKDPVQALARACRVRARRVVLREGWWREDNGALLGRWDASPVPLALLPVRGGGYEAYDPADGSRVRLDEQSAARVGPTAYMVYRPFPAEALRPLDVLRFGLHGCRADVLTALTAALLGAALGLVLPLATGMLFEHVIPGADRGQLVQMTLILLAAAVAGALFTVVRGLAIVRIESRTAAGIQAAVWDRLIALPLPFFRDYSAGELAMRAMNVEEIRRVMTGAVVTGLLAGLFSLSNLFLLFHYDFRMGAVGTALILVSLVASVSIGLLQLRSQRSILTARSKISGMMLQFLTGISKLKLAGAESQAFSLWARAFGEQRDRQYRNRTLGIRLAVFNAAYPVFCSILLFRMAAATLGTEDAMGTGAFLGFTAAFGLCLGAVLSTSTAVLQALNAVPLYEQVKPILHTPPEVRPGKDDPGELSGAIELQHVSFRYQADGPQVLRDVSVRINPGEFVAFVGPSGSGKSTCFRLLLGFDTPELGSVSYDEQDLAGLDVEAVRRQMGVVLQSGRVMSGDLFTNIAGSSTATLDDAWEAARMAGLDEDIRRMPMGMHTMVSDGGGTLSGGQRQRLMIARAIVGRPRILLMDEATSALDNRTQAIVSESLDRLRATRVVIAHRLSTILHADRIHVLVAGEIVESGSFDELMALDGVFAAMARRQLA
ncbi:MAG TPA: NHLP bacteriocin export ABC transporter permease/ATPase subunit [Longimicrobium sp.]|jgi:ATP-binding cassette subfamily C protein|uniref:NHLP bacteriocin export ABC transporter permease/ATPase subunit n=1 Tax=Longimicrobium sp. TaxID=2029185 RepID=UPI002EDA3053